MNRKEKVDLHLDFLETVYLLCEDNGSLTGLINLAQDKGIPNYNIIPKAMKNLGIVDPTDGKGNYKWKSTAEPNRRMASDLVNEKSSMAKASSNKRKQVVKEPERKLVPIDEIKENAKVEARKNLIRAVQAADVLGINLLTQPEEVIEKFMVKLS